MSLSYQDAFYAADVRRAPVRKRTPPVARVVHPRYPVTNDRGRSRGVLYRMRL